MFFGLWGCMPAGMWVFCWQTVGYGYESATNMDITKQDLKYTFLTYFADAYEGGNVPRGHFITFFHWKGTAEDPLIILELLWHLFRRRPPPQFHQCSTLLLSTSQQMPGLDINHKVWNPSLWTQGYCAALFTPPQAATCQKASTRVFEAFKQRTNDVVFLVEADIIIGFVYLLCWYSTETHGLTIHTDTHMLLSRSLMHVFSIDSFEPCYQMHCCTSSQRWIIN